MEFKNVVKAFAVLMQVVGDPAEKVKSANPIVAMPKTPGAGLPAIDEG